MLLVGCALGGESNRRLSMMLRGEETRVVDQ
jgi:hypothetical protein